MKRARKPESELAIGEIARRAAINASAIRYYEREGLIPAARRRGGKRVYGEEVLGQLAVISAAKRSGFTIAEIKQLIRGLGRKAAPGPKWRSLAANKIAELDARIEEAEQMKAVLEALCRCRCPTLDDCGRILDAQPRS